MRCHAFWFVFWMQKSGEVGADFFEVFDICWLVRAMGHQGSFRSWSNHKSKCVTEVQRSMGDRTFVGDRRLKIRYLAFYRDRLRYVIGFWKNCIIYANSDDLLRRGPLWSWREDLVLYSFLGVYSEQAVAAELIFLNVSMLCQSFHE